ncbi:hypothetical protein BH20ACT22_BH20ACT22_03050 [soil metagenome]
MAQPLSVHSNEGPERALFGSVSRSTLGSGPRVRFGGLAIQFFGSLSLTLSLFGVPASLKLGLTRLPCP